MFLTLESYLAHFPNRSITREQFVKSFVVTYASNPTLADLFNLKSVIKTDKDPRYLAREEIIDYLYDVVILHRHQYLTEFYKSYFELPNPYGLKWDGVNILTKAPTDYEQPQFISAWTRYQDQPQGNEDLMLQHFNAFIDNQPLSGLSMQKNDQSRRIVRNLNYLDILHYTRVTNTCKSKTSFWQTFENVYNKLILEDRFFAPSSIGLFLREKNTGGVNYNNFFYLFQQYQPKASILNPYTINWVLKNLLDGKRLFTPVLSWASYLCAFMHSDWEHYVGVDVMRSVCDRCQFLFDYYQRVLKPQNGREATRLNRKRLDLYCQPSESLLHDAQFMKTYTNYFDAVLMCPPYFNMEIYPSGQQSLELYPDYQQWLFEYWETTVVLCLQTLRKGGKFAFIVNNYVSLKKEDYPLIQDLNMIVLKYMKLVGVYNLLNRVSPLRVNHKKRTEMLFIYQS
jgi:hypothetical protein